MSPFMERSIGNVACPDLVGLGHRELPIEQVGRNGQRVLVVWDGLKAHRSALVRDYVASTEGDIELAFVPPYAPDLNPVEYLWAWLKRHALANFCPANLAELKTVARAKLKSAQQRVSIINSCWAQAGMR